MNTTLSSRASDLLEGCALDYRATVEGNAIVVHDDVDLGADALATMTFIAFLQTCIAEGVEVRWSARVTSGALDTAALHHLWPPTAIAGLPPEQAETWRATFRYGLCYFRRGPDFLLLKDSRNADGQVHLVIDHPDLVATFLAGCAPLHQSALTATQREAVGVLSQENLVYRLDDLLLTLPTRMRRWPMPFSSV
jgi:hypothetical protein